MTPLIHHLWQSTLFAGAVAALAYSLRGNRAAARYWLWLAASLKFLVPFALLLQVGGWLAWRPVTAVTTSRPVAAAVEQASVLLLPGIPAPAPVAWLPLLLGGVWAFGVAATVWQWRRQWVQLRDARRAGRPANIAAPVLVLTTPSRIEPGVFGIWRPVMLLPEGIAAVLPPEQMEAIVAHEMSHIRRRDNLFAALHMAVETLFWFHPLVWWIGARLTEERERACDEEVLRLGLRPEVYAEGILNVCEHYLQSPLACASGVTGAELRTRIREIIVGRAAKQMTPARVAILTAAALFALALPLAVGVVQAQGPLAFDVASIKPANPEERNSRFNIVPGGGINVVNVPLRRLVEFAYNVRESQIQSGPGWINSMAYDIVARVEKADGPIDLGKMSDSDRRTLESQIRSRTQSLLEDRFQLKIRRETREMPILALTVAKGGLKLKPVAEGDVRPTNIRVGRGTMTAQRVPMSLFVQSLSRLTSQTVTDETGLAGAFDIQLEWAPDLTPEAEGPSIYTAMQEKLGLRLESKKGPVEIIVIERVEKPSEN